MKTSDVVVLGGLAYLLLKGRDYLELPRQLPDPRSQEEVEKRWVQYTPEPIEKTVYGAQYAYAKVPIASLVSIAQMIKGIWDIPTTEGFGVYGVDKGTYQEYYYTL